MKTFHSIYQELFFFFKENSQHFSGFIKKGWGAHPKNKTTCRAKQKTKTKKRLPQIKKILISGWGWERGLGLVA